MGSALRASSSAGYPFPLGEVRAPPPARGSHVGRPHPYLSLLHRPPRLALPHRWPPGRPLPSRGSAPRAPRPLLQSQVSHAGPSQLQSFKFSWDSLLCAFGSRCERQPPPPPHDRQTRPSHPVWVSAPLPPASPPLVRHSEALTTVSIPAAPCHPAGSTRPGGGSTPPGTLLRSLTQACSFTPELRVGFLRWFPKLKDSACSHRAALSAAPSRWTSRSTRGLSPATRPPCPPGSLSQTTSLRVSAPTLQDTQIPPPQPRSLAFRSLPEIPFCYW